MITLEVLHKKGAADDGVVAMVLTNDRRIVTIKKNKKHERKNKKTKQTKW